MGRLTGRVVGVAAIAAHGATVFATGVTSVAAGATGDVTGSAIRVTGVGDAALAMRLSNASVQPRCSDSLNSGCASGSAANAISSACGRLAGSSASWASIRRRTSARALAWRGRVQAPVDVSSSSGR